MHNWWGPFDYHSHQSILFIILAVKLLHLWLGQLRIQFVLLVSLTFRFESLLTWVTIVSDGDRSPVGAGPLSGPMFDILFHPRNVNVVCKMATFHLSLHVLHITQNVWCGKLGAKSLSSKRWGNLNCLEWELFRIVGHLSGKPPAIGWFPSQMIGNAK